MRRQRSAKIVATLGPASASPEMIDALFRAGADVFRLNFSHGKHEDHRALYDTIRALEKDVGRPIGIMADLQGPKLRVGTFAQGRIKLAAGRAFRLAGRGLLERFGVASQAAPLTSVALGYLHHLVVATAWGVLLAILVQPFRGIWRILVTGAMVAGYVIVSLSVLPAPLRIGYGVTGNAPGAVPIAAALLVALLSGIWLDAGHQD